jgi:ankyrin repeat protein
VDELDINAQDNFGDTALQLAVNRDLQLAVKLLLTEQPNPNLRNQNGKTPLSTALKSGYRDVAKQLIAAGAEVNAVNEDNQSALYLAARLGDLELVQLLLAKGASVEVSHADLNPLTAVRESKASAQQKQQIIQLLQAQGMSFDPAVAPDSADTGNGEPARNLP